MPYPASYPSSKQRLISSTPSMEAAMNTIIPSYPVDDITFLNHHDLAIRQFCPARLQQHHHQEQREFSTIDSDFETSITYHTEEQGFLSMMWEEDHNSHHYHYHDHHDTSTTTTTNTILNSGNPELIDDDFVASFINVDPHHQPDNHIARHHLHFQDTKETFALTFDHDHDLDMDGCSSFEDLLALPFEQEQEQEQEQDPFLVSTTTTTMSSPDADYDHTNLQVEPVEVVVVEDQGLHLVHLLLACAEAVGCRDTHLAQSLLSQIWGSANPWGDSLQRVSHCFATGLQSRLSLLLHNVNANGTFANGGAANDASPITGDEKIEAFHLLHQTTPYVAFGFMAANEAISQAAQGKEFLHIIDLGMFHALQWPSLLRTLASRQEGPPKRIKITGLTNNPGNRDSKSALELYSRMKSLSVDAQTLGIPEFEFNLISDSVSPALFTPEKLGLKTGEALFVNSVMSLHKFVKESRGSLKAILQAIRKLGPALLTVVEQDANHNGPFFLGRFLESLHYYSAIFDSLEASLQRNSIQRVKMEKHHFAEEIKNIVAYEGSDRVERHERADQWRRQLGRAGFQAVGLKCMSQARMMLSVYGCDGYTLASEKGFLLLGWKGRPIMLASAWQVHPHSASAGSS